MRHDWPSILKNLERQDGRWVLIFRDHPVRVVETIRTRRSPQLRGLPYRIETLVTNAYTASDGTRRGDIHLRTRRHDE